MMHRISRKVLPLVPRSGAIGLAALLLILAISVLAPQTGFAQTTGPTPTPAPGTTATVSPAPGTTATVSPAPGTTATVNPAPGATATVNPQGHPKLNISKTVDPPQSPVGTQVIFTVVVTNNGTADASNVTVSDPVPSQFQVLSASTTKGAVQISGQVVSVSIGTMAPGEVVTITIVTRAQTPTNGPVTNKATAVYQDANGGNPRGSSVDASVDASIVNSTLPHSGKSETGLAWWVALAAVCAGTALFLRRRPATGK